MGRTQLKLLLLIFSFLFLSSCGKVAQTYCSANYSQGNFSARITYVIGSLNTFEFQICSNSSFQHTQVTVYGVPTRFDIATINPAVDARLPHLVDNVQPGDVFVVTFASDDSWFVIFEDDNVGNYDLTNEILRGELR